LNPRYTDIIETPFGLYHFTSRRGYLSGETIQADMYDLDGSSFQTVTFQSVQSPGSGFAGQVWQARILSGEIPGLGQTAALKVLHPRSGWKTIFRDLLFGLSFQTGFAPRLREEALRAGLIWQEFVRCAAETEFGPGSVARPFGYYWDAALASYVEVCQWIDGRPIRLEANDQLFSGQTARLEAGIPLSASHDSTSAQVEIPESTRLKFFMDRLAALCRQLGAIGLARQYAWYTFVSQANVMVQTNFPNPFCAVDFRPGLAFPFFLPFTPSHLKVAFEGLIKARLSFYAEIDLVRLQQILAVRPQIDPHGLLSQLLIDESAWRQALPDLWNHPLAWLSDPQKRAAIRAGLCNDWLRLGWMDEQTRQRAAMRSSLLQFLVLISAWPFALRVCANKSYRTHLRSLFTSAVYRNAAVEAWRGRDLSEWVEQGRVPSGYQPRHYLLEKVFLSIWSPGFHRFWISPQARRQLISHLLLEPLHLLFSQAARETWLADNLRAACSRGAADPRRMETLLGQLHEERMRGFIRDLGFIFGLDIFSRLVYLALAAYGLHSGDYLPLGIAVLSPLPPSGPLRFLYVLVRLTAELPALLRTSPTPDHPRSRLPLARLAALVIAPLRWAGNLFPLVEISAVYPRLAFLLAEHLVSRAAAAIPIFGGPGKLLEIWIFQACFNLPLSLQHWILTRYRAKK
jgi:hypothetical protein